jgi:hypothetical protein
MNSNSSIWKALGKIDQNLDKFQVLYNFQISVGEEFTIFLRSLGKEKKTKKNDSYVATGVDYGSSALFMSWSTF